MSSSSGPPKAMCCRSRSRGARRMSSGASRSGCPTGCTCRMLASIRGAARTCSRGGLHGLVTIFWQACGRRDGPDNPLTIAKPRPAAPDRGFFLCVAGQQPTQIHRSVPKQTLASIGHDALFLGVARTFSRRFCLEPPEKTPPQGPRGMGGAGFFFRPGATSTLPLGCLVEPNPENVAPGSGPAVLVLQGRLQW
jgi:hypothetical protein